MTNHEETTTLPPKTCSIERLVTMESDVALVLQGKKTATRRSFVVDRVYIQTLGDLMDEHANQEGFESVEDYKQSILSYHPGMPWLPHMTVWVHEFSPVKA